jgi:hypothetical protein
MTNIPNNIKLNRFMLTFVTSFRNSNGTPGMKYVNTTISRTEKSVPLGYIKQAQDSVAAQLQFFGVQPENITDVCLMSCSYLGLMNEKEFTEGLTEEHKAAATLYTSGSTELVRSKRKNDFDA